MTPAERDLYLKASEIIKIAMGREKPSHGRRRNSPGNSAGWNADLDPLAWWCGVEAIVSLVKEKKRRKDPDGLW